MIKFSSSLKLNEVHMVDSLSKEDPQNNFFSREALISGEGQPENSAKWAIAGISIVMQIEEWSISKKIISPYPLVPKSL